MLDDDLDDDLDGDWSGSDYEDFDDTIDLDVVEFQSKAHGSVKSFESDDGGWVYYSDDPTGFTISVERVLQVDGWEDSSEKQLMSLIVLKIVLACNDPDQRIRHVTASFKVADDKKTSNKDKVDPDVVAWAPFDTMVRSGELKVDHEQKFTGNTTVGGSGGGANLSGTLGFEKKISWSPTYFDEAFSIALMGAGQKRRGVRWKMQANPKEVRGVPPQIMVALLISRKTDKPYFAKFRIRVTGGRLYNLVRNVERVLGLRPGSTKPYHITPNPSPTPEEQEKLCRYEGKEMVKQIHPNNLGELRTRGELTSLTIEWGREVKKKDEDKQDEVKKDEVKKDEAGAEETPVTGGAV